MFMPRGHAASKYTPPPPPLKNAFWPQNGGGGGYIISPWTISIATPIMRSSALSSRHFLAQLGISGDLQVRNF